MSSRPALASRLPALSFPIGVHNQVLFALVVVGIVAVVSSGFVGFAPNRLVSGKPIALWESAGNIPTACIVGLGTMLLGSCFFVASQPICRAVVVLAAALLFAVLAAAGQAGNMLAAGANSASRISLGAGFWIVVGCAALAVVDALQRLAAGTVGQLLTVFGIGSGFVVMAASGTFDALSITREYESHDQMFADAVLRHLALVAASVAGAVTIGFPLGVAAVRSPRVQGPLFGVLNILQTIPSIALFGLLIVPLSSLAAALPQLAALGFGGIGVTPAIIALVLYALLPVVRNTSAGLAGIDRAAVEAGRGMGLTGRQIFWQVELPLSLPVLLAGLRIVTVQAIGLAVVAALIGAGGLGTFVFEGLGQYAVDLVLLGALPAIFLALGADFMLQILSQLLRRRFTP